MALSGDGDVWVFLGDGQGFLAREVSPELPEAEKGCKGYHVRLVDLDADGRDEIIAAFAGESGGIEDVPDLYSPGCNREGSLRAWKVVLAGS